MTAFPNRSSSFAPVPSEPTIRRDSGGSDEGRKIRVGMRAKTLLSMLAVGLLPLVLFGAFTLNQQRAHIRGDAEAAMQATAERISVQVDDWVDQNARVLQAAASLPAVASMQPGNQTEVLAAVQKAYPWMYLVFTISPDGHNVARSDGKPLTDYSDRQYFKDVVNGKELSWETLFGKTSNKAAFILALPIKANGRLVGVLAAAMTIEDISQVVAKWKAGATGFAFLVDEKAKVVSHPREEFVVTPTYMAEHPLIAAFRSNGQSRLLSFMQTDGRQVLGYVQGNKFRWAVAVQQDEEEVFAPLRTTITLGVALLAVAALFVTLVALFSTRRLIRPIVEMTSAANKMSLGDLEEHIVSTRNDELGLLAQALERLRKSMKAAFTRLNTPK